ncbi:hypothetical protein U27_00288 [Candidatus Vecturithrix granuli]|uniref:Uncharacterized protein n=1 Tax=Vecturithrix granuli TaxID=1499967 RepID=A0A081C742_VECG1|nr:hypothetical protein U27_00288 [Candidatus Vecturithrix granuli]
MNTAQQKIDALIKVGAENLLENTLRKLIKLQIARYQHAIKQITPDLKTFEREFKMSSDECYRRFNTGELGDNSDLFEWVSLYENVLLYQQRIRMLETVLA